MYQNKGPSICYLCARNLKKHWDGLFRISHHHGENKQISNRVNSTCGYPWFTDRAQRINCPVLGQFHRTATDDDAFRAVSEHKLRRAESIIPKRTVFHYKHSRKLYLDPRICICVGPPLSIGPTPDLDRIRHADGDPLHRLVSRLHWGSPRGMYPCRLPCCR